MDGLTAIRELRRMETTGEVPRRYPVIGKQDFLLLFQWPINMALLYQKP